MDSTGQRLEPEQEIAKLKHAISALIPWVASSGRGAAQEALADACELIGIDPLAWSAHPDVLLRRRPELDRRGSVKPSVAERDLSKSDVGLAG